MGNRRARKLLEAPPSDTLKGNVTARFFQRCLYVPAYPDLSSSRMISNLQGTPATTTALEQICYVVNDCWWPH